MQMIPAKAPEQKFRPKFYVTKLDGVYKQTTYKMEPYGKPDKNGDRKHRLVSEVVEKPRGWLVTFPKPRGEHTHSTHIDNIEDMEKYGFTDTEVPLVDGDGELVGSIPNVVRKEKKENVNA